MSITIRYFASLGERLGRREQALQTEGPLAVGEVWARAVGEPLPENVLAAVNQDYATLDAPVRDGDEVAFFPPVTGG
jgi:molybdopterin synthase sulfur carrier subunit